MDGRRRRRRTTIHVTTIAVAFKGVIDNYLDNLGIDIHDFKKECTMFPRSNQSWTQSNKATTSSPIKHPFQTRIASGLTQNRKQDGYKAKSSLL
jgi:hypothetical protein